MLYRGDIMDEAEYLSKRHGKGGGKVTSWYKQETINGLYYTPYTPSKTERDYTGNGNKVPSPKEILDYFSKLKPEDEANCYYHPSGYFELQDKTQSGAKPVTVPGGTYIYYGPTHDTPERLAPMNQRVETYIPLNDLTKEVQTDIAEFVEHKPIYTESGIFYKLGIFLYGEPGNGKSSMLREILQYNFPEDTIVIYLYAMPSTDFLKKVNESLKDRLKVFVFEEFVTVVDNMPLHVVLNFLDGEHSVENSITFATTNYPEKLPLNIVDRPSRFDKRYKIGNPDADARKKLLQFYLKKEPDAEEISVTNGLSIAGIKEACMLVRIKKLNLKQCVETLKAYSELVKKDFAPPMKKIGM